MSLSETRFGANATGLPGPTPLPSLTAALSRRAALFGAVTVAGVSAAAAIPAAIAAPGPTMSPEAAALLREFHDVAARFNAAFRRLDAAQAATARVPEPDELFARGGDFSLLGPIVPCRHWRIEETRPSYGFKDVIAQLRTLPAGSRERKRVERRDEIVCAWDRWHADEDAARDASGEAAAGQDWRVLDEEHDAFVLRLVHLRTADPDVMRIKAAVLLNMWGGDACGFDTALDRVVADEEWDPEHALSFSLMRDMMHGLGAGYRVTA